MFEPWKESHMKRIHLPLIAAAAAIAAGVVASSAAYAAEPAQTQWEQQHPRRDQVNDRLANQNRRIGKEVKEGEMSKAKAAKVHREDRQIRREERTMASQNGGHITKTEQRAPNQQENHVSKQIGK